MLDMTLNVWSSFPNVKKKRILLLSRISGPLCFFFRMSRFLVFHEFLGILGTPEIFECPDFSGCYNCPRFPGSIFFLMSHLSGFHEFMGVLGTAELFEFTIGQRVI